MNDNSLINDQHSPTRRNRVLELHLNPSLTRSVTVVPGMSDHDGMVLVDCDLKPKFNRPKPQKINIFPKANWSGIAEGNDEFNSQFQKVFANRSVETN